MDAVSYSGMLDANQISFGIRALPSYSFDKANIIVSFGADFLGNWITSDYAHQYTKKRNPNSGTMCKHYQLESTLSLTGSNADEHIQIKPSEQAGLLSNLYDVLNGGDIMDNRIKKLANDLLDNQGKSLVVCNSNDDKVQILVNAIMTSYANAIIS